MKPLYTQEDFEKSKSKGLLQCQCYNCNKPFLNTKHTIQRALNTNNMTQNKYCSKECQFKSQIRKLKITCINCNKEIERIPASLSKSGNNFCSRSCSASYNNKHKTTGNRRSKLEIYLEEQLTILYSNLHIEFNKKDTIGSELDIYIPSLNVAFELNGIFHYEPIYGTNRLDQIKNNDQNKFKSCIERKIDLCIIDTSQQKYFKIEIKTLNILGEMA